jgi:hypothetical protein
MLVDIPYLTGYNGSSMGKADGVKAYIFCYEFGYVVSITNQDMSLVSCMVVPTYADLSEITRTRDVMVAEMVENGDLVLSASCS